MSYIAYQVACFPWGTEVPFKPRARAAWIRSGNYPSGFQFPGIFALRFIPRRIPDRVEVDSRAREMLWIVEKGRPLRNVPRANLFRTISLTIDALGREETKKKKLLLHEVGFTTWNLAGQSCSLYIATFEISAEYFATINNYSPTFYSAQISMNYLRVPCPMLAQQMHTSRSWHTRYRINKIF